MEKRIRLFGTSPKTVLFTLSFVLMLASSVQMAYAGPPRLGWFNFSEDPDWPMVVTNNFRITVQAPPVSNNPGFIFVFFSSGSFSEDNYDSGVSGYLEGNINSFDTLALPYDPDTNTYDSQIPQGMLPSFGVPLFFEAMRVIDLPNGQTRHYGLTNLHGMVLYP